MGLVFVILLMPLLAFANPTEEDSTAGDQLAAGQIASESAGLRTASTVSFVKCSWDGSQVVSEDASEQASPVPSDGNMTGGWYYLNSNVTVNGRISLTGDTNLILGDGCKLEVKGLYIPQGKTLTIYGQTNGTGKLVSKPSGGAAIGGYSGHDNGNIVIHGGTIEAKGYDHCAGIGSNDGRTGGAITIYGGTITAIGGSDGAAIGGGRNCSGGAITIYGGTVNANDDSNCSENGAGIGGGDKGSGGTINIYGGTITTYSRDGAGIGGGDDGDGGAITINGGAVTCQKVNQGQGARIGGGCDAAPGTITINGGDVTVFGGSGAGIGGGKRNKSGGTVIIDGGVINASGSYGIGKGESGSDVAVVLGYMGSTWNSIKVTASSFGGTVVLSKPFAQRKTGRLFQVGVVADNSLLAGEALTYWSGVGEDVAYVNAAGEAMGTQKGVPVTAAATTWSSEWYAVSGNVSIGNRVQVVGTVNLILCDGCNLNATKGISVPEGSHLIIWAQSGGTGSLTATGAQQYYAGIGGYIKNGNNMAANYGSLTINGGRISATGGECAAGIGTSYGKSGALTVNGGEVTATGGQYASGIGAGVDPNEGKSYSKYECYLGNTKFYGGKTKAVAGEDHNGNVLKPIGKGCALNGYSESFFLDDGMKVINASLYESTYDDGYYSINQVWSGGNWIIVEPKVEGSVAYSIAVDDSVEHGTISASATIAHAGAEVTVSNKPDIGYEVGAITVTDRNQNSVPVANGKFTVPSSSVTVSATFRQIDFGVTVDATGRGGVTADHTTAHYGDTVKLAFDPNDKDCFLSTFTVKDANGRDVPFDEDTNSFKMPASNVTITAVYDKTLFKITTAGDAYGNVTAPENANVGETVALRVTPNENCRLVTLMATADGESVEITGDSFVMPKADVEVTATFEPSYPVTIASNISGGTVMADKERAFKGESVTLAPARNSGYQFVENSLAVRKKDNDAAVDVNNNTFIMPDSGVTVTAQFSALQQALYASLSGAAYGSYTVRVNDGDPVDVSGENLVQIPNVNTDDDITVTFTPAANGRIDEFYLEDFTTHHEKHRENEIANNVYTFNMPGDGTEIFARFVFSNSVQTVSYIDESGDERTVEATVLTGFENQEYYDYAMRVVLGESGKDTWYYVPENINYNNGNSYFQTNLFLKGRVHLIVADGKTLNIQKNIIHNSDDASTLTVYGQAGQTGKLVSNGFSAGELHVYGGEVGLGSISTGIVDMMRGALSVKGNVTCQSLSISSGVTSISGTVGASTSITLGCANADDRITIGTYNPLYDAVLKIAGDQVMTDGFSTYTGILSAGDASRLGGRTLMLVHEHNEANLTHHEIVPPTCDSATGTYTDGTREYYTCSLCGGCLAYDSDTHTYEFIDPDTLTLKYFTFWVMPSYPSACYLRTYDGADTDVRIPETVPAELNSALAGRTITSISNGAFAGKTGIESITFSCGDLGVSEEAFKGCTNLTVYSPHSSAIYQATKAGGCTFVPTDRHVEPTWTWAADYSSATATFNCDGTCGLNGDEHARFADDEIALSEDETTYTAQVVVDGETYTGTATRSLFALQIMDWNQQLVENIRAGKNDTVATVKNKIAAKTGISAEKQVLIYYVLEGDLFGDFELEDDKTLEECGVDAQSLLMLIMHPYTITWKNDDGSVIDETGEIHGEMPIHADPTKAADDEYIYTFAGWSPEIAVATKDTEYTATFTAIAKNVSVSLDSSHAKKAYTVGDVLDVTGLSLELTRYDGDKQTVAVTTDMVTGFNGNKVGKQTLTVTYKGLTDTYEVEVRAQSAPPDGGGSGSADDPNGSGGAEDPSGSGGTDDPGTTTEPASFTRLWGDVALDTMVAIVNEGWSSQRGGTVVLTTINGYWDALTAAGIAGMAKAPVLMTDGGALSDQTRAVIESLAPTTIVACGGTAALSDWAAAEACEAAGGAQFVRCWGQTATGTAVDVFHRGGSDVSGTWSTTAFVCTNDGYWDALAAAPISYARAMPIFLTEGASSISDETIAAMQDGGIKAVYIVGGTAAIDDGVAAKIQAAGIEVADRLWGAHAVETSEAVADFGLSQGMGCDKMGVATTNGYWDALSGAPLCGLNNSVLVLAGDSTSSSISGFMAKNKDRIGASYVFGGEAALDASTYQAIQDAIG